MSENFAEYHYGHCALALCAVLDLDFPLDEPAVAHVETDAKTDSVFIDATCGGNTAVFILTPTVILLQTSYAEMGFQETFRLESRDNFASYVARVRESCDDAGELTGESEDLIVPKPDVTEKTLRAKALNITRILKTARPG